MNDIHEIHGHTRTLLLPRAHLYCLYLTVRHTSASFSPDQQSGYLAVSAALKMGISTEAIIAIIALFIALPPIIFKGLQWVRQRRQRTEFPGTLVFISFSLCKEKGRCHFEVR